MKKQIHVIFLTVFLMTLGYGQDTESWFLSIPTFEAQPSQLIKGPYLQNVSENSITIMWESTQPLVGKVRYGIISVDEFEEVEGDSPTIHEVALTGLNTETDYQYQVISGDFKSEIFTFKTAVKKDSPFSIAAYGDNKSGPFNYRRVAKLIYSKQPNFVFHNGDFVQRGNVYRQWEKLFFNPARVMINHIPLFGAIGNHEDNAPNYYNYFSFPGNERWYSFDFGNSHFIILDTEESLIQEGSDEIKWLINDLENRTATWTFVGSHHPPFTAGGNYYRKSRLVRKNLLHPIFEKYGVDVVFSGHDHNYERSEPIVSKDGENPVTYIVCGNGGTPLRYIGHREWTHYAERVFGFVLVNIEGSRLHFQAFNIDNEVIDEFTLDKSNPESVNAYLRNKVYYEDIDDHIEAIEYYSKGDDLMDADKYADAIVPLKAAYEADPTFIEALVTIAECYFELGDFKTAERYALMGVKEKPNYPDSYEVLIDLHVSQGNYEEAIEWCKKWQPVEADTPDPLAALSEIYEEQEKYDLAIDAMQQAIMINPADGELYGDLGNLLEKTGDRANALLAYQLALDWFLDAEEDEDIREIRGKVAEWTVNQPASN